MKLATAVSGLTNEHSDDAVSTTDVPPQGEYRFPQGAPYTQRYELALAAATDEDDSTAMHSLGLLTYQGIGGLAGRSDPRQSAIWHAKAAARGNIDG